MNALHSLISRVVPRQGLSSLEIKKLTNTSTVALRVPVGACSTFRVRIHKLKLKLQPALDTCFVNGRSANLVEAPHSRQSNMPKPCLLLDPYSVPLLVIYFVSVLPAMFTKRRRFFK